MEEDEEMQVRLRVLMCVRKEVALSRDRQDIEGARPVLVFEVRHGSLQCYMLLLSVPGHWAEWIISFLLDRASHSSRL